ncbi:MAG: hypothetical protein D6706_15655, partial [Chloroflexi bacterium]
VWILLATIIFSACAQVSAPTATPTTSVARLPTDTPAPTVTFTSTPTPTAMPTNTITPTATPTTMPTATPTVVPRQPTDSPSTTGWQVHSRQGFELELPGDWVLVGPDGIECAALYQFYPSSIKLINFSACWQDTVGDNLLTFAETYERFREAFIEGALISSKTINGIQVEVIQYRNSKSNGIYVLTASHGTVALWQWEGTGWALIDEGNQYQENQVFGRILASFKFHEE